MVGCTLIKRSHCERQAECLLQTAFEISPALLFALTGSPQGHAESGHAALAIVCGSENALMRYFQETIIMATGTVKFFNGQKGFGFIAQDGGGPDVFVHVSAIERAGMRGLAEGQKITFDIEADRKNGKSAATNLQAA